MVFSSNSYWDWKKSILHVPCSTGVQYPTSCDSILAAADFTCKHHHTDTCLNNSSQRYSSVYNYPGQDLCACPLGQLSIHMVLNPHAKYPFLSTVQSQVSAFWSCFLTISCVVGSEHICKMSCCISFFL